jgi:hypothetical protein
MQPPGSNIQTSPTLSPGHWFNINHCSADIIDKIATFQTPALDYFQKYRATILHTRISQVFLEQTTGNNTTKDVVDDAIYTTDHTVKSSYDPYTDITSMHPSETPCVIMGDPIRTNSNSFESVRRVLESISSSCGVGAHRQWTAVGCDGQPYDIASKLMEQPFTCPACGHETKTGVHDFENT